MQQRDGQQSPGLFEESKMGVAEVGAAASASSANIYPFRMLHKKDKDAG